MKRRGQAALEFLTTYGWALLVILVMIGALVYFGVLNPSKVLPNSCNTEAGFECKEYVISSATDEVQLNVVNRKGEPISDISVVSQESDVFTFTACSVASATAAPDSTIAITCTTSDLTELVNTKAKANLVVQYRLTRGTMNQTFPVTIFTGIQ